MDDDFTNTWRNPENIDLNENELHIWYAGLEIPLELAERLFGILSEEEQLRAERYVYFSDRNKFIAGRAMLRTLLGWYSNCDPQSVSFSYNAFGKPEIQNSRIKFNLSHSASKAVFAFTLDDDLGTDIEKIRSDIDVMELAAQFFSSDEVKTLKSLPPSLRKRAFFHIWTRKEAFIKADGKGLSMDLKSFSVPVLPFYSDDLLPVKYDYYDKSPWKLKILKPDESYSAAIAVMKDYKKIRFYKIHTELGFFYQKEGKERVACHI